MAFFFWRRQKENKTNKEHELLKNAVGKVAAWVNHLHKRDEQHENNIDYISRRLAALENDVSEIKEILNFFGPKFLRPFKQQQTAVDKQTAVQGVQTPVQTTGKRNINFEKMEFFWNLSMMERAIVWILLNTDLKLSYEDIAAILGKNSATVRGQVNNIKQKQDGLIAELIEKSGKKRLFIPDEIKENLLKAIKLEKQKKVKNNQEK